MYAIGPAEGAMEVFNPDNIDRNIINANIIMRNDMIKTFSYTFNVLIALDLFQTYKENI